MGEHIAYMAELVECAETVVSDLAQAILDSVVLREVHHVTADSDDLLLLFGCFKKTAYCPPNYIYSIAPFKSLSTPNLYILQ